MKKVLAFLGFQAGWFACVLGAARGAPMLGPTVVAMLVAVHFWYSPKRSFL